MYFTRVWSPFPCSANSPSMCLAMTADSKYWPWQITPASSRDAQLYSSRLLWLQLKILASLPLQCRSVIPTESWLSVYPPTAAIAPVISNSSYIITTGCYGAIVIWPLTCRLLMYQSPPPATNIYKRHKRYWCDSLMQKGMLTHVQTVMSCSV